jgi:hypothetical protein
VEPGNPGLAEAVFLSGQIGSDRAEAGRIALIDDRDVELVPDRILGKVIATDRPGVLGRLQ